MSNLNQISDYPEGARVESIVPIQCHAGSIPAGTRGIVTGHCDDGRAWIFFDGYEAGHTFHEPEQCIRVVCTHQDVTCPANHEQPRTVPDTPYANAVLGMRERRAMETAMRKYPTRDEIIQDRDDNAYTKPRTEQPASVAGSETTTVGDYACDNCGWYSSDTSRPLGRGVSVGCPACQYEARYVGSREVPHELPAPAAQETGEWYDHDDPRHIYHTVFNPSGCDKFYCLERFDATYQSLSAEQETLREVNQKLVKALQFVKAFFNRLEHDGDENDPLTAARRRLHAPVHAAIDAALNEQGKGSG